MTENRQRVNRYNRSQVRYRHEALARQLGAKIKGKIDGLISPPEFEDAEAADKCWRNSSKMTASPQLTAITRSNSRNSSAR